MYERRKIGKVLTSKSVGTGPSSFEKRIYWAAVSQRLRNTELGKSVLFRGISVRLRYALGIPTGNTLS